ncbi:MAG: hypothetical protein WCD35_16165, partial [Mycobacteriales bacterium]
GLLVALALLLLAGVNGARSLRADQARAHALAGLHLSAVVAGGATSLVGGPRVSLEIDLQADNRTDVHLRSLSADRGWRLAGARPDVLVHGLGQSLVFERQVDCRAATAPPQHLHLTVGLDGVGVRQLEVLVSESRPGAYPGGPYFCGDLDASQSLALVTSNLSGVQDHSTVTLGLVNASLHPVTARGVSLRGFALTSRAPFPFTLPGRRPGILRPGLLAARLVVLDARVADCGRARAYLDAAQQSLSPDVIDVAVDGHGGPGTASLELPGLAAHLGAVWRVSC